MIFTISSCPPGSDLRNLKKKNKIGAFDSCPPPDTFTITIGMEVTPTGLWAYQIAYTLVRSSESPFHTPSPKPREVSLRVKEPGSAFRSSHKELVRK